MYNRYIPQEDGSYQKNRVEEPKGSENYFQPEPSVSVFTQPASDPGSKLSGLGIGSFFRNLLPQGLDAEDLIVILLLLLISGNDGKDGNQAMLTLGAYLFL